MMNATTAATQKVLFHIRFATKGGGGRWVKSVSWVGDRAAKMVTTANRAEAFGFSRMTATRLAGAYYTYVLTLHASTTGELHAEATAEVLAAHASKRAAAVQAAAEFDALMREAVASVPGLREAILSGEFKPVFGADWQRVVA